jgi:hypothetical protein
VGNKATKQTSAGGRDTMDKEEMNKARKSG